MFSENKVGLALLVLMLPYTATADRSGGAWVLVATSTSTKSAFPMIPTVGKIDQQSSESG
jgi:hypothetical protein